MTDLKKYVFKKFKFMLGARCIDWNRPFDVYLTPRLEDKQLAELDDFNDRRSWDTIVTTYNLFKIGSMVNPSIESINNQTGMESEACYEEMEELPASAVIFSKQCPSRCYVKRDYEYSQYGSTPWDAYTNIKNGVGEYFNSNYWDLNYGFTSAFSQEEYDMYNLKTTPLTENVIKVVGGDNAISATSEVNKVNPEKPDDPIQKHHMCGYGILLVIHHKDAAAIDKRATRNIPVAFIPFDRFHDAKNGIMNIVWNNNGFLRLE